MRHDNMQRIAACLAVAGIATFRYQFPFMERGGRSRDPEHTTLATVRSAVQAARHAAPDLPLLAGGHSFGGRMTSLAASEVPLHGVQGLVLFAFPLHPAGKPSSRRADHISRVTIPMLLLSGTRDRLADRRLLAEACCGSRDKVTLYEMVSADHGYRVLRREHTSPADIFEEMAQAVVEWIDGHIAS